MFRCIEVCVRLRKVEKIKGKIRKGNLETLFFSGDSDYPGDSVGSGDSCESSESNLSDDFGYFVEFFVFHFVQGHSSVFHFCKSEDPPPRFQLSVTPLGGACENLDINAIFTLCWWSQGSKCFCGKNWTVLSR